MSYNGYITKAKNIRPHSNADRLMVAEVFGNSVIIGKDITEDELIFYLPVDGRVGLEFAEANNLLRKKDENGNNIGGYLDEEKRNITALKLRGEKSDGLVLKLSSLSKFTDISKLKEGEMISVLNGVTICEKYIPVRKVKGNPTPKGVKIKKKEDTVNFPLFQEHLDTSQLAYNLHQFKVGDQCIISLKLHGTSQRTSYALKEEKSTGFFSKLFKRKIKKSYEYVCGTRRVVLKGFEGGFYGSNAFRQKWHEFFVGKLHKGETIYGELVGFMDNGGLIMPECDNKKTNDKEFIKQYGSKTRFTYGCNEGENDFYIYRMTLTTDEGHVVEYPQHLVQLRAEQMGAKVCPVLETFTFTTQEDLMERVNQYMDIVDPIGKTHVAEGIIVRIDNKEKFTAYKHKSWSFKVLEGLIKADADAPDMEEAQQELSEA